MRTKATFIKTAVAMALATTAMSGAADAVDLVANASATLITLVTVTEDTAMDFGNIAVIPGSDNTAWGTIVMNADTSVVTDPAAEANGANVISLTGATAGVITVFVGDTAAIPMVVTVPATATLTLGVNDDLDLSVITVGTTTVGSGTVGDCSGGCVLTSAVASGNITFPLGATMTMAVGNGTYGDGTYAGTFTISAIYQ